MSEISPVCVECRREMQASKTGATFEVEETGIKVRGDIFHCPGCGKQVGANFGDPHRSVAPVDVSFTQGAGSDPGMNRPAARAAALLEDALGGLG